MATPEQPALLQENNFLQAPEETYNTPEGHTAKPDEDVYNRIHSAFDLLLYASGNENFEYAAFFRDWRDAARKTMSFRPAIAMEYIANAVYTQAETENPKTEAQPGMIPHEWRDKKFNGGNISQNAYEKLQGLRSWSEANPEEEVEEVMYYGSKDASMDYISLVSDFCIMYPEAGQQLLGNDLYVVNKRGEKVTVSESLDKAATWIETEVKKSDSGLFEYKRANPVGIFNQTWKDSNTSANRKTGEFPNIQEPLTYTALQGKAIDALVFVSDLKRSQGDEKRADELFSLAKQMHTATCNTLWMEDAQYWAHGFDKKDGEKRIIDTMTSDGMELLTTKYFFDKRMYTRDDGSIDEETRKKHLIGTVRRTFDENFVTDAGILCRSMENDLTPILGYIDYHGRTVWPKHEKEIIDGLRYWRFYGIADEHSQRFIESMDIVKSIIGPDGFPELFYVDENKQVIYHPIETDQPTENSISGTNVPEKLQTWTWASEISERYYLANMPTDSLPRDSWVIALDMEGSQKLRELKNPVEEIKKTITPRVIDIARGRAQEKAYLESADILTA